MSSGIMKPETLVAELIAESVRQYQGAVGVLIRDVPHVDPGDLLKQLSVLEEEGIDLRVAILHNASEGLAEEFGFSQEHFTTEVEQAERWRNQRDLQAVIVVVASGDEAKLTSLEEFEPISSRYLKSVLIDRALGGPAGANEVQGRWWRLISQDDRISLGQLVDYYLSLYGLDDAEFVSRAAREVHRLGLLPDAALFNDPNEKTVVRRIQQNLELVRRLQTLNEKDRKTIASNVAGETSGERRRKLNASLTRLRELRWGGKGLSDLTLEDAQALLGIRKGRPPSPSPGGEPPPPPPEKARMVEVAAKSIVQDPETQQELDSLIQQAKEDLEDIDESQLRPEKIVVPLESGIQVQAEARTDVINLVTKLIGEGGYGGLVKAEGGALDEILRRFQADQDIVQFWNRDRLEQLFVQLDHPRTKELSALFAAYDEQRASVLPLTRLLCVEPLAVAAAPQARSDLLSYVQSYRNLLEAADQAYSELFSEFSSDVDELMAHLLVLETIIFKTETTLFALIAPTHPLYLWHYTEYCRIVDEQRELLSDRDKELVVQAAQKLPNFLTSVCIPHIAAESSRSLPHVGRVGPLPYYGPEPEVALNDDGVSAIDRLIRSFVRIHPPARFGLRLALLDPPDAGRYLSMFCDLAEAGVLEGGNVLALRHQGRKVGIELQLTPDEEDRVARYFRSVSDDRRFVFNVLEIDEGSVAVPDSLPVHIMVAFDQTPGKQNRTQPALHPIQPLALTRRLRYRPISETVELEPAPGGVFASYNALVEHFDKSAQTSYFSTHQLDDLRIKMSAASEKVPWYVIADRNVDRDLALGRLRIFTARDGDRDVASFSSSTDAFRRALRDVARQYNTAISDDELDALLVQLSDLLNAGVLALVPDELGKTNFSGIKGLLGTLIAARWYRGTLEEGHSRLLVSLDSAEARRWLHLSPDPLRADLLGIEFGDNHFNISILEVKAVQNPTGEYQIADGVGSGPAVSQMLATRRLVSAVFTSDRTNELITTPARREILREHVFRELSKAMYTAAERKMWVDELERLFEGNASTTLRCQLVDVRLGVDSSSLETRDVRAKDANELVPLSIVQLNETGVEALRQKVPVPSQAVSSMAEEGERVDAAGELKDEPQEVQQTTQVPTTARLTPESRIEDVIPQGELGEEVSRARAYLGEAPGAYGKPREVWFDPALPGHALPNPHVSISGETGSGKTQVTKAIVSELSQRGLPSMILDFKDDYSQPQYVSHENFDIYDASFGGLPFNPMVPPVDPQSGHVAPLNHVHQLGEIVKRIYELGDQQAFRFREALKQAFDSKSIGMKPFVPNQDQEYPPFEIIEGTLRHDKENETLLGRLSPIFDLGLFSASTGTMDFAKMADASTVIRLSQLPGDEIKNSVAEFFLMALYNHLIRLEHPHVLRRLLVLDEAWRLVKSPFLEPLMREGRAFGLGVILATQYPKDLPDPVGGATATRLFFSQTNSENVREIQRTLIGKTSGADAEHLANVLRQLPPLTCLLQNNQYTPYARTTVLPYFERAGE